MYCKAHGGGKRCLFSGCTKGEKRSTPFCKAHGGGKRCLFDGGGICPKTVHSGTNFCVAHGGGKMCSVGGCTKSACRMTHWCMKHGGGKRCRTQNCGKNAQDSTDFCKAHCGGKRCNWDGEGKCEKFAIGNSELCASHTSMVYLDLWESLLHGTTANLHPSWYMYHQGRHTGITTGTTETKIQNKARQRTFIQNNLG